MNTLSKIISSRKAELRELIKGLVQYAHPDTREMLEKAALSTLLPFHFQSLLLLLQGIKKATEDMEWNSDDSKESMLKSEGWRIFQDGVYAILTEAIGNIEKK